MQPRTRVIKSSRNDVNLCPVLQEPLRRLDVTVHASVDECVVDDALAVLRPLVNAGGKLQFVRFREIRVRVSFQSSPWPGDLAGLRPQTPVGIEISFDQICATQASCDTEVLHCGSTFKQQSNHVPAFPVESLLQWRPITSPVNGRAVIEQ